MPNFVKRTLTTMQITQFLVGASFAAVHLFVSYTVPLSVAHKVAEQVTSSVSPASIASTVSSAVSSVTESASAALPTATGPASQLTWSSMSMGVSRARDMALNHARTLSNP